MSDTDFSIIQLEALSAAIKKEIEEGSHDGTMLVDIVKFKNLIDNYLKLLVRVV